MLTKTDKKEIVLLMSGAIEELVLPRFDEIDKRFDNVENRLDKVESDISIIKEDLSDVQLTVNRIETLQRSELNRVDDHEVRIGKLEKTKIA